MVKVLMRSIVHDSRKHAEMFQALAAMVQGLSESLKEEEYKLLDEAIRKHVEIEYDMMIFLKKLLEKLLMKG